MVSASKDSGIEYLREHVREDTRMYYTFLEAGKSREAHEAVVYGKDSGRDLYGTA